MRRFLLILGAGAILLTLNILAQEITFEIIDKDKRTNTDEFLLDLKNDKYVNSKYNPILKSSDIPKLLKLASNDAILANFPTNPISSFAMDKARLGTVALWLIEGIRKNHGEFDITRIGQMPSQNALLIDRSNTPDKSKQMEYTVQAAQLYSKWVHSSSTPESFNWDKNPLEGSNLRWK